MGVIFYFSVMPIGVFLRMIGKRTMGLRPDPEMETYWIERRPPGPPPETMSDEWAVPLCALHHRSLQDVGDERRWWECHGIDPLAVAERLWSEKQIPKQTYKSVN